MTASERKRAALRKLLERQLRENRYTCGAVFVLDGDDLHTVLLGVNNPHVCAAFVAQVVDACTRLVEQASLVAAEREGVLVDAQRSLQQLGLVQPR